MPRLNKPKGNKRTVRLSIEDEYINWCGWKNDEFVSITTENEPQSDGGEDVRVLIIKSLNE